MKPRGIRVAVVAVVLACGPAVPTTRLYRVQVPTATGTAPPACERGSLLVRDMQVAGGYDDARMVYRESEYRLQRYEYHEWIVPPGPLVSDALRDGYAASGRFARVEREYDASIDAALQGRVLAIEEVDLTRARWVAHLRLDLELLDARTHEHLWSHAYDLTHPLEERSPDGLAAATSAVLREVIDASAPELAAAMSRPCPRTGRGTGSQSQVSRDTSASSTRSGTPREEPTRVASPSLGPIVEPCLYDEPRRDGRAAPCCARPGNGTAKRPQGARGPCIEP